MSTRLMSCEKMMKGEKDTEYNESHNITIQRDFFSQMYFKLFSVCGGFQVYNFTCLVYPSPVENTELSKRKSSNHIRPHTRP